MTLNIPPRHEHIPPRCCSLSYRVLAPCIARSIHYRPMDCSHSSLGRSEDPPQGSKLPRRNAPEAPSSTDNHALGSASKKPPATTTISRQPQDVTIDNPSPVTAISSFALERRPLPSGTMTARNRFVTPGGDVVTLTEDRRQLLQSIREGPSIRDRDPFESDRFRDAFEKVSPETIREAVFNERSLRGVTEDSTQTSCRLGERFLRTLPLCS